MIFYLTYNDLPSGIYSSQVIDVVKFFNNQLSTKTKLVAFISIRNFLTNRKKIKHELPESIILPMFPGVHRWQYNYVTLKIITLIYKPTLLISRSVIATQLSFKACIKTIYDGRGAITEEWQEYSVVTHPKLLQNIKQLEKECVLNSHYKIAVSHQLVKHWQQQYNYNSDAHVVIPCTLNNQYEHIQLTENNINDCRKRLGLCKDDVVFIYSGSVAGWQSFELLANFITPILQSSKSNKLIFLSHKNKDIEQLQNNFKNQVIITNVEPQQVPNYLIGADYGLLIREGSITNKVASPVKFAEYLACGLKVIISDNLGDYSKFVKEYDCGYLYKEKATLVQNSLETKQRIIQIAKNHFTKTHFSSFYKKLLN